MMEAEPDGAWTIQDLAEKVYSGLNRVEKKHRVSVLRAVKKIVSRDDEPDWDLMTAETMGNTVILCDFANVHSYAVGRLKTGINFYRNPDPRSTGRYLMKRTEAELRELLAPGGRDHHLIEPGGEWDCHVKTHIAKRDGNHEEAERLERERQERIARTLAGIYR